MKASHQLHGLLALLCINSATFAAAPNTAPETATPATAPTSQLAKCACDFSQAALSAIMGSLKDGLVVCSTSQSIRLSSAPDYVQKKPASSQTLTFINTPPKLTNSNVPTPPQATWTLISDFEMSHGPGNNTYWFCNTQASDPSKGHPMDQLADFSACQNDLDAATQSLGIFCKS
jgi:hypothetical protein